MSILHSLRSLHALRSTLRAFGLCALFVGNTAAAPLKEVTYLLPAPETLPSFAPWLIAQHKGYYAAEGYRVKFMRAKGGVDAVKQAGLGNAEFAGAIGDTAAIVRPNGIPVKAVALLGGGPLMIIGARHDAGIKTPADLKGKTVTVVSYQDTTYYALLGVLAKFGLNKSDVDIQAAGPRMVSQSVAAGTAAACACSPDWTVHIESQRTALDLLPANRYFPTMAPAMFASDKFIAENPEAVRAIVKGTLRAMAGIMADPSKATADYIAAVPSQAGNARQVQTILERWAAITYPGQPLLGQMDANTFRGLQDFYFAEKIIRKKADVAELFTNRFVEEAAIAAPTAQAQP